MSHYDCRHCGAYLCAGECVPRREAFLAALKESNLTEEDYYLLHETKLTLLHHYKCCNYVTAIELKKILDKVATRIKDIPPP